MEGKNRLIRHKNKKSGVTYLYWGHSTYVPGKKYPEVKKKCIGKIDSKGEFEPNKSFLSLSPQEQMAAGLVEEAYLSPPPIPGEMPLPTNARCMASLPCWKQQQRRPAFGSH